MDDILIPKERRDAVVLIGVDDRDRVEFVRVYALTEELAMQALEEFFNAKGLFPTDYRLVSRGNEPVGGRKAITTRSEVSLSSALARLGLKLLSNGILYLEGVNTIYQITLVSEDLYSTILSGREKEVQGSDENLNPEDVISLGVDVLVENLSGRDISDLLPENAVLLREPPLEKVASLLNEERDYPLVVETKNAGKYAVLDFPVVVRLPPLTAEEFAAELSSRLGIDVDPGLFSGYLPEKLNLRNAKALVKLVEAIVEKWNLGREEALKLAIKLNLEGL
ncbi:hypothetical protein A3K92_00555 [Thermococcus gorgonarius]|uniref:Uncharacterized protein n=2 Tax=Thermococcus gorgonarius TaxID=71997 RepID=A0A2Z2M3A2_THEGO|nr:hypothetical protein A3K92_00555 [Thermococcus gorgonarius]